MEVQSRQGELDRSRRAIWKIVLCIRRSASNVTKRLRNMTERSSKSMHMCEQGKRRRTDKVSRNDQCGNPPVQARELNALRNEMQEDHPDENPGLQAYDDQNLFTRTGTQSGAAQLFGFLAQPQTSSRKRFVCGKAPTVSSERVLDSPQKL